MEIWTKVASERRVTDVEKLAVFGWLAIASYATGHFREMATWSARQLRLARQVNREPSTPTVNSLTLIEALLNVARSEFGQGNLARSAFFSAEALVAAGESANVNESSAAKPTSLSSSSATYLQRNPSSNNLVQDCRRLSGYCHLVAASAAFEGGALFLKCFKKKKNYNFIKNTNNLFKFNFVEGKISNGLEHLDRGLLVARQCSDQLLELLVQMGLAQLFVMLKDYHRALHYCGRCESMAKALQPNQSPDITACRRSISLCYAVIMRKLGRPDFSENIVQELLSDSSCTRDPSLQANCFILLGDLARNEGQTLVNKKN